MLKERLFDFLIGLHITLFSIFVLVSFQNRIDFITLKNNRTENVLQLHRCENVLPASAV